MIYKFTLINFIFFSTSGSSMRYRCNIFTNKELDFIEKSFIDKYYNYFTIITFARIGEDSLITEDHDF